MIQETSLLAYISIQPELNQKQAEVLRAIQELNEHSGPCTDLEIAHHLGWAINRITPRRKELQEQGYISPAGRRLQETGRSAITWVATQTQI